jgi:hypothetical protein
LEDCTAQTCETKSASGPAQKGAGLKSLGFADTRTLDETPAKEKIMYLDIVIIDYLSLNGEITNYRIKPNGNDKVLIDRLVDVHRSRTNKSTNIGGTRLYNSKDCTIDEYQTSIRNFSFDSDQNLIRFQFEHLGVPVGPSRDAHGGMWNFILPPRWKLRELYVVDPYDRTTEEIEKKKSFRYGVIWDSDCNTQLVEMELRSGRGSFSFLVKGTASLIDTDSGTTQYFNGYETTYGVTRIRDIMILDKEGREILTENVAKRMDWIDLKPNIFGFGINLNKIIKDSINNFRKKNK